MRLSADLLGPGANRALGGDHMGVNGLTPPVAAARVLVLNNTQPLLKSGQLRWALNNVATAETPSCLPTLAQARLMQPYKKPLAYTLIVFWGSCVGRSTM